MTLSEAMKLSKVMPVCRTSQSATQGSKRSLSSPGPAPAALLGVARASPSSMHLLWTCQACPRLQVCGLAGVRQEPASFRCPHARSLSSFGLDSQKGLPRRAVLNTSTLTSRAGSLALHHFPSWNFTALLSVVCVRFGVRVFVHTRIVHIFVYACVTDHCRSSPRRR